MYQVTGSSGKEGWQVRESCSPLRANTSVGLTMSSGTEREGGGGIVSRPVLYVQ